MKGPGLFSDIGKKAKDLLAKDYTSDQKFTISSTSASGVELTSAAVKRGNIYSFDVGSQYKYKNTVVDLKLDTATNISTTVTISDILPYTKAIVSAKLPDYNSGKLELQFFHDHVSLASVVAMKQNPVVEFSGTIGGHGFAYGADVGFDSSSGTFVKYSTGLGLTNPEYNASVVLLDKGDTLRISYVKYFDEKQKTSFVGEIVRRFSTNENIFTVGGQCTIDSKTTVKAKLNNTGKLAALLQHEVSLNTHLTISDEVANKFSQNGNGWDILPDVLPGFFNQISTTSCPYFVSCLQGI